MNVSFYPEQMEGKNKPRIKRRKGDSLIQLELTALFLNLEHYKTFCSPAWPALEPQCPQRAQGCLPDHNKNSLMETTSNLPHLGDRTLEILNDDLGAL